MLPVPLADMFKLPSVTKEVMLFTLNIPVPDPESSAFTPIPVSLEDWKTNLEGNPLIVGVSSTATLILATAPENKVPPVIGVVKKAISAISSPTSGATGDKIVPLLLLKEKLIASGCEWHWFIENIPSWLVVYWCANNCTTPFLVEPSPKVDFTGVKFKFTVGLIFKDPVFVISWETDNICTLVVPVKLLLLVSKDCPVMLISLLDILATLTVPAPLNIISFVDRSLPDNLNAPAEGKISAVVVYVIDESLEGTHSEPLHFKTCPVEGVVEETLAKSAKFCGIVPTA